MERELEELQFLDIVGVVEEAFKILRSAAKLLGSITLTLLLPLSFAVLGHNLISKKIIGNTLLLRDEEGTSLGKETLHNLCVKLGELFLFEAAFITFRLAFSLLSTTAVVYTVASVYMRKELSYIKVMTVVPRVWKRFMFTLLSYFAILFAYYMAVVFVVFFAFICWILITGNENLKGGGFSLFLLTITAVSSLFYLYMSTVWQLASVVSVVEENWGFGAMKKSKDLIKGKRGMALALNVLYELITWGIGGFFQYDVVHGREHQIGVSEMSASAALLVALKCGLLLLWLLIQSVFYFVCKSFHHESIDKSALSDRLEAYVGEYMLLKEASVHLKQSDF